MESKSTTPSISAPVDNKQLKHEDLLQFLNAFSSEFNNSSFNDRVLVFQVEEEPQEEQVQEDLPKPEEETLSEDGSADIHPDTECLIGGCQEESKQHNVGSKAEEVIAVEGDTNENQLIIKEERKEKKNEEGKEEVKAENEEKQHGEKEESKQEKTESDLKYESEDITVVENNGYGSIKDGVQLQNGKPDEQLNEHKIFVHSCFLAVQSSYFKALFHSGMKESHSKEVVMKITQSEFEAHLTLIEAMYKLDILNNKDYEQVVEVLVLADKYDVDLVFKKCKYVLMDTPVTLESCEFILENVKGVTNCDDLLDYLKMFLVEEFKPLDKTWTGDKFIELSEASLKLLLSSDKLAVQSENTVFVALMKWIKYDEIVITTSSLLSLVRFELMTVDFLYDVVRVHPTAKIMVGFNEFLQQGLGYHCFSKKRQDVIEDKPVQRAFFVDEDPALLWVIDKNAREELLGASTIYSNKFYYKGYKMKISLKYEADSNTFGILWKITNSISEQGSLELNCKVISDLFTKHELLSRSHRHGQGINLGRGWGKVQSCVSLESVQGEISHTIEVTVN